METELQKRIQRITELIIELHTLGVSKNRLQQVVQFRDYLLDDMDLTEADRQTWAKNIR